MTNIDLSTMTEAEKVAKAGELIDLARLLLGMDEPAKAEPTPVVTAPVSTVTVGTVNVPTNLVEGLNANQILARWFWANGLSIETRWNEGKVLMAQGVEYPSIVRALLSGTVEVPPATPKVTVVNATRKATAKVAKAKAEPKPKRQFACSDCGTKAESHNPRQHRCHECAVAARESSDFVAFLAEKHRERDARALLEQVSTLS